eukprot:gene12919-15174_t
MAWTIGWDLTLEYMVAASTVARGWSGYIESISGYVPHKQVIVPGAGMTFDIIAFTTVIILTLIVARGMKESTWFNTILTIIKLVVIVFVIIAGSTKTDTANWSPFTPYGAKGIFNAAAITFFSYLGFDGVCNVTEECKNPKRDIPIGILGSLGISTVLYMIVSIVITLMVPYTQMDLDAPLAVAFTDHGMKWATIIVSIGAFCALTTAQLSGLISQPRLYYSLSRDGLLPSWFSEIHPRYKTPYNATLFTGIIAAGIALCIEIGTLADLSSIGTLLSFNLVSPDILLNDSRHSSRDHYIYVDILLYSLVSLVLDMPMTSHTL